MSPKPGEEQTSPAQTNPTRRKNQHDHGVWWSQIAWRTIVRYVWLERISIPPAPSSPREQAYSLEFGLAVVPVQELRVHGTSGPASFGESQPPFSWSLRTTLAGMRRADFTRNLLHQETYVPLARINLSKHRDLHLLHQ